MKERIQFLEEKKTWVRTGQSLDFCRVEACADERSRRKGRLARSVLGAQLSILLVHREYTWEWIGIQIQFKDIQLKSNKIYTPIQSDPNN